MDEYKIILQEKNKATIFLERNEIWFKTVLSLAVTLTALFISIASYNISKHQAQLSASLAESQALEKQPFFTIENCYDDTKNKNIYVITNTGGQIRDCTITVFPFLHIDQHDSQWEIKPPFALSGEGNSEYLNHAFIYLPGFYQNETQHFFENGLFAFSDIQIDHSAVHGFTENDVTGDSEIEKELADDYFRSLVSFYNTDKTKTYMSSSVVYYVEIFYSNYENEQIKESLWLDRALDLMNDSNRNTILFQHPGVNDFYEEAKKNSYIYSVDSLNEPLTNVVDECRKIIELLFEEFDQIQPGSN